MYDINQAGAVLSENGLYRYRLWRQFDDNPAWRTMTFIMLNPSTADASKDDPTIKRCIHFARREGCNRLEVVNLFAYRTPHPSALREAMEAGIDIEGPENEHYINQACENAAFVVVAWGANAATLPAWLHVTDAYCLGTTKDGYPKHPLARGRSRIADDQPLIRWPLGNEHCPDIRLNAAKHGARTRPSV